MKRFFFASFTILLLVVTFFTSGCGNLNAAGGNVISCFSDITLTVDAVVSQEEVDAGQLDFDAISIVPDCIQAAVAVFSSPSNATPSSPEVDINQSANDGTSTASTRSNTWQNCTGSYQTLQFDFSVPFKMFVGGSSDQSEYDTAPILSSSDNDLIAQQLFQQYGSFIQGITTNGPSQSVVLNVPPETQVVLTLPMRLNYRTGEARVVHTDGSTVELPWLFTDGYQQSGPISYTEANC